MTKLNNQIVLFALRNRQLLVLAAFGVFMCLAAPSHAHALTIDFSDITGNWASVKGFAIFLASAVAVVCLIITIFKAIGRDWGEAIMWGCGAAACAFIATHAAGWISSETGVTL